MDIKGLEPFGLTVAEGRGSMTASGRLGSRHEAESSHVNYKLETEKADW